MQQNRTPGQLPRPAQRIATCAYLGLAALDTALAGSDAGGARRLRWVTKPLLMPTLHVATRRPRGQQTQAGSLAPGTAAARLFSWMGDIALLGRSDRAFLTGVGSFALAHLAYIVGFWSVRDPAATLADPGVKVATASWLAIGPAVTQQATRKDPVMGFAVAGYGALLGTMFASSTQLDGALPARTRRQIGVGTALFLLSDSILAATTFLRKGPGSPGLERVVMATYTAGQWLIADATGAGHRAGAEPPRVRQPRPRSSPRR